LPEANDNPSWSHDFTVSHWLRLGSKICLQDNVEREEFWRAFRQSGLTKFYLESSRLSDHPIHNILRFIAVIQASHQQFDFAFTALNRLHELDPIGKNQFNFALVMIACQAEVAGLLLSVDVPKAKSLLDDPTGPAVGLSQLFDRIRSANVAQFPRTAELVDHWEAKIHSLISTTVEPLPAKRTLLEIGSQIRR
jgi:hypothetical protein